jgi:hypothetical protein
VTPNPFWVPPPIESKPPEPPARINKKEIKPEPPPPKKKEKEKQVFYNLVGDPIMGDDE